MADQPRGEKQETPSTPQPWGPGPLMIFGLALLVVAGWCGWDLYSKEEWRKAGDTMTILFNWGGVIAGIGGAIYTFVLAAKRSKKDAAA